MYILGISAFYHDSAAALIKDGVVIAAVEEERFTRIKHSFQFPYESINFCLKYADITIDDIDHVAYYEKTLLRFERILDMFIKAYPLTLRPFVKGIPEWVDEKIKVEQKIRKKLKFKKNIFYIPHHISHASASYFSSGFDKSAILTIDGIGEYQTTGLWLGEKNKITPLKQINFPDSIGLLYSAFTAFLGFRVNEDEYKAMGLAAYGKPTYKNKIYELIDVKDDGSFKLDLSYFKFREEFKMWSNKFENMFGKPRKQNEKVTQKHKDIASSIQCLMEEIYFKMLNHLYSITKTENLCIGGGVALNALANGKIFTNTPFKNVYVIGPAGDGGNAMGAALFAFQSVLNNKKKASQINNLYLGSEYTNEEIKQVLDKLNLKYKTIEDERELVKTTAKLIANNKIVGWFQGRMEYGPRALGSRSILANPKNKSMKDKVNKIKIRELFRPFAGSVLKEHLNEYFEIPKNIYFSPFMIFCFVVKEKMRKNIAAIVHEDYTCRVQSVSKEDGLYYSLIKEFYKITGIPVVLNTSFNLKGEPIVETPEQAINDFLKTAMDYLVIGDYLVSKSSYRE